MILVIWLSTETIMAVGELIDSRFLHTVDSEMFARTLFLLIFAKSLPREFKVLANIENT